MHFIKIQVAGSFHQTDMVLEKRRAHQKPIQGLGNIYLNRYLFQSKHYSHLLDTIESPLSLSSRISVNLRA
jgi:formamidopyrimidine-DNA glycosylase